MALDFPPHERDDPILSRNRLNRREGTTEIEENLRKDWRDLWVEKVMSSLMATF